MTNSGRLRIGINRKDVTPSFLTLLKFNIALTTGNAPEADGAFLKGEIMNLFEIDQNLQAAFEAAIDPETGEILDDEMFRRFDELQFDRDAKIENICLFIKNLKADAIAIKAEKDAFAARQKSIERKAEALSNYLKAYLNGQKFKSVKAAISWRKSESVNVTDISKIPEEFLAYAEPTPKKAEIKAALKAGKIIEGAEIVENNNMIIK